MPTLKPAKATAKRRRTQSQRRETSTSKILDAAAQLFAQQGYDRTTLAQISERSGYSAGLVAHRFGSKADLVRALLLDIQKRSAERILSLNLENRGAIDAIEQLIGLYRDAALTDKPLRAFFVLMAESAGPLNELRGLFAEHNRGFIYLFEAEIQKGQRSGEIRRSMDGYQSAVEIAGLLRGVTLLWLIDPEVIDPRPFFDAVRMEIRSKLKAEGEPIR